jgi:hypothetical protein
MSTTAGNTIEVEVDHELGRSLDFFPIGRQLRSRLDFKQMRSEHSAGLLKKFPDPIPGQIIGINPSLQKGWIREPLHDARYAAMRKQIEKAEFDLAPEITEIANVDVPTWLFWLRRALDAKCVRVLSGKVPQIAEIEGQPRTERFGVQSRDKTIDTLVAQNQKLIELLLAGMSPEQRKNLGQ